MARPFRPKFDHARTYHDQVAAVLGSAVDDMVGRHSGGRALMGLAVVVTLGTWVVACVDRLVGRRRRGRR
jgi:hypothetical protein